MTIKEKVIREAIKRIESSLKKIDAVLDADPLGDIIRNRQEFAEKFSKMDHSEKLSQKTKEWVDSLYKKEKELFALSQKQIKETPALIAKKVKLESELCSLRSELWFMDKNNFKI